MEDIFFRSNGKRRLTGASLTPFHGVLPSIDIDIGDFGLEGLLRRVE